MWPNYLIMHKASPKKVSKYLNEAYKTFYTRFFNFSYARLQMLQMSIDESNQLFDHTENCDVFTERSVSNHAVRKRGENVPRSCHQNCVRENVLASTIPLRYDVSL